MRKFVALVTLLALPAIASAQVSSVFGRTGAVVAQTGDYSAPQVTGTPLLNATNTWTAYQLACLTTAPGCPSPRVGVAFNAVGKYSGGENNLFDGVAYDGTSQFVAERYSSSAGGVAANASVGGFWGAAQMSTGSDPVDAGMQLYTTETQTTGHNGMGLELDFTANGSTALNRGLSVSPQGKGGVTVGGGFANNPYSYSSPSDLGTGTVHAADSIESDNHFITNGGKGTISSCGTGAVMSKGNDQAGQITTGGAVTTCTYTFAKAYGFAPICLAQVVGGPTPTAYLNAISTTSMTVNFSSSYNGPFWFICMGITS